MNNIYIFGDSISEGIGSKKYSYCIPMKQKIKKYKIINCAKTGTTLEFMKKKLNEYSFKKNDIVIIYYGSVDSILRPNIYDIKKSGFLRFIPKRYFDNGMLDPRAFYSKKLFRRMFEKTESFFRYKIKLLLMKKYGTYQRLKINEFKKTYDQIIKKILLDTKNIYLVTLGYIDEKYFPGSPEQFEIYNEKIRNLAKINNCSIIDLSNEIKKYNVKQIYSNDYFHPHYDGYQIIGDYICDCLFKNKGGKI